MEHTDARASVAALFQKHHSGERSVSRELAAAVLDDLRRAAREHATGADRATPRAPGPLSNLYFRVAADAGLPAGDVPAFLVACGTAMRLAVVDHMRREGAKVAGSDLILRVDTSLDVVEEVNARLARVVECRYFAALADDEAARALQMDVDTLRREWTRARAWTLKQLAATGEPGARTPIPNGTWVDAVFDDALSLPAESLEPFLERCAAAPGDLRARVEELLNFSAASKPRLEPGDLSPDFLWSILIAPEAPGVAEDRPVPAVAAEGGWRTVCELSRGRLGSLYLAERTDGSLPAKGVLRFLPPTAAPDLPALRQRSDWRALASISHAGIARVIDTGCTDGGRLFIVSELVEGRPLNRYCDDELLPIEQRLDLFAQVCLAVQYAHRKLAVHGGIKPSTVVVTAGRQVKLLDFGMAGLFAPASEEQASEDVAPWVPSPSYASPEQVRGEPVAVASDVYQLGLLLYLLLTGEHAQTVTGASKSALMEAVCATIPESPSERVASSGKKNAALRRVAPRALVRKLRGDLDAIVMYSLRKEPDRRYPSVSLLHSDLQRWVKRLPVWAQNDTRWYRLRKFVERRGTAMAAAAILAFLGVAALRGPAIERLYASRENARVTEVQQLLAGISGAPGVRPGVVAPNAIDYVDRAARTAKMELAGQPVSQSRLFADIGEAYSALGHYQQSITILEEALALRRAHFGDDSLEVAATLERLGQSQHQIARYDEAETNLRTAIAVRQVRQGAAHPETVAATIDLASLLYSRGQFLEAERMLRGAVGILRPDSVNAAATSPMNELLPRALRELANVLRDRGALAESAGLYREVLALLRQTGREPDARFATVRVDFSRALIAGGELDRAEAELAEGLPALRRAYPGDHPLIGMALRDLGMLRIEQGRLDEAETLLNEAQRLQEKWLGRVHPALPRTRALLAELARRRGQLSEAVSLATGALDEFDNLGMPDHPWTIDIRATLADALIALEQREEAARVLTPALAAAGRFLVSYDAGAVRLQNLMLRATNGRPASNTER